jgi:HEAT repeat protein
VQLDLFAAGGLGPAPSPKTEALRSAADLATLSDSAILAAIPDAGIPLVLSLMREAGRRRLPEAIPVLGRLCRIFAGFGTEREVPEQTVALDALASIGGQEARLVASGLLDGRVVQGPTLKVAVRVAAALRCRLSAATVLPLLRHADPEVRAIACNIARPQADVNAALIELLTDLDANVRASSACALGRFGRQEARAALKTMLRRAPTPVAIEAIAPIADHECIVLLGRIAGAQTDLTNVALDALALIDDPLAFKLAAALPSRMDPRDRDEDAKTTGFRDRSDAS